MTDVVVIGIGNTYRRDDGVGPAVAAAIEEQAVPEVRVVTDVGDPTRVIDAWTGARLAVVIDAAVAVPSVPGRIHHYAVDQVSAAPTVSCHGVDLATLCALGEVLGRMPDELVVFAVEVADTGFGAGLTPAVRDAVPHVVEAAIGEVRARPFAPSKGSKCPGPTQDGDRS